MSSSQPSHPIVGIVKPFMCGYLLFLVCGFLRALASVGTVSGWRAKTLIIEFSIAVKVWPMFHVFVLAPRSPPRLCPYLGRYVLLRLPHERRRCDLDGKNRDSNLVFDLLSECVCTGDIFLRCVICSTEHGVFCWDR